LFCDARERVYGVHEQQTPLLHDWPEFLRTPYPLDRPATVKDQPRLCDSESHHRL
jgi:hypothetical protein